MMHRIVFCFAILLLAALATLPAVTAQKNDKAETLLQAAQHKQLVEGDLKGAIQLYQQIIAQHGNNRAAVAKALVQLGKCYEKQGLAQARRVYDQVVRDYGDQREMVAEARTRLSALNLRPNNADASSSRKAASGPVTRLVWTGPDANADGGVSPDGRYLAFLDETDWMLAIRDLATGEKRRLTNKASQGDGAEDAVFSPDSKQIAYTWRNNDEFDELRIIRTDGSGLRILYSDKSKELSHIEPCAWSPDSKLILAFLRGRNGTQEKIALISVTDGSPQILKTLDRYSLEKMSLSPDGRYIAYSLFPAKDSSQRDIFILATDGSRDTPLVQNPTDDSVLSWSPDGKMILFARRLNLTTDVWRVAVEAGKAQGRPELIKENAGNIRPLGFSQKGSFYFGLTTGQTNVFTATLDPVTGKVLAPPTLATSRFLGTNGAAYWSPDGKYLAYRSQWSPNAGHRLVNGEFSPNWTISILDFETGQERIIKPQLAVFTQPRMHPNGQSLLVQGQSLKYRQGIHRVDVETGEAVPVALSEAGTARLQTPLWSPDGKAVYYAAGGSIWMRNLETKEVKEIYRPTQPGINERSLTLSPDGKQIAFTALSPVALMVIPTSGGTPRELLRLKGHDHDWFVYWGGIAWTSDGRHILFFKYTSETQTELWRISAAGGEPEKLGLSMEEMHYLSAHPDGRRIAFSAGSPSKDEVWVMENFLSAAQTRKTSASRR